MGLSVVISSLGCHRKHLGCLGTLGSSPAVCPGSEIVICSRFPLRHYLVWWVTVKVKVDVRVIVTISKLFGSG